MFFNVFKIIIFFVFFINSRSSLSNEANMDKKNFEKQIEKFILENPEVLLKSIDNYRKKAELRRKKDIELKLTKLYESQEFQKLPFVGKYDSDLILIEFIDYNCGYCKKTIKTVNKLVKNMDKLKVVFVDFPILSESSIIAAKASLAASEQNSYFKYHSKLLEHIGPINDDFLLSLAKELKLDLKKFKQDMELEEIEERLRKNIKIASSLNIRGTPTFIFKDDILAGAYEYEQLEILINQKPDL